MPDREWAWPNVTRFTRVWIETLVAIKAVSQYLVTRFTRVWIETIYARQAWGTETVTRFTRVWIETRRDPHLPGQL